MVTTLYTGPIGAALGVDISWIVGLVVISPLYYVLAKNIRRARPADLDEAAAVTV